MSPVEIPDAPPEVEPKTAEDFLRRGWSLHARGDNANAEADFNRALALDAANPDGYYGLGLALKVQQRPVEAQQAFRRALDLVRSKTAPADQTRATLLRHLLTWQIESIG